MYAVTRSGPSIADVIADARDVPERVVPYAASTAINKSLSAARTELRTREMPRVFDRPNAWTLNSLRVHPASVDNLVGSIDVKNDNPNNGARPEDYLLPNVIGGPRKEKRFERNMRYAGILAAGHRAVPGTGAKLDQYGNMPRGQIQKIMTATRSSFDRAQNRTNSRRSRRNARNAQFFVGGLDTISIVGGEMVRRRSHLRRAGIYERSGRQIKPVLIFTSKQPQYRKRLDFGGVVERIVSSRFPADFNTAAANLIARRRR